MNLYKISNLTFFFAIIVSACNPPNDQKVQSSHKEISLDTLMAAIDKETSSFFAGNYEGWKDCWLHDSLSSQTWNNDDGSFSSAQGWEAIDKQGKDWIEKYYKNGKNIIHPEYFRKEIRSKILSDTSVYLTWTQYNAYSTKELYGVSRETRLMILKDGKWKIFQVAAFWDFKNKIGKDFVVHLMKTTI